MSNAIEDFKPREYQVELFERVLKGNTIIFLPTGSGKTFIAVMLLKHKSNDLKLLYSEGGKRTFFLVDTVALVAQQAQSIRQQTPLTVGEYSGEKGVDHWDINQWHEELENHQVLVMTAAIFHSMILHKFITLARVNLLIIDECHHAVNRHPMRLIMVEFEKIPAEDRPHVLGLTATLINSNCKPDRILKEIHNLEVTFHAKIARAENEEMVQAFSTNPKEEIVNYDEGQEDECYTIVYSLIEEISPILQSIVLFDNSPKPSDSPPNAILINNKSDTINEIQNILKEIILITKELGGYASTYLLLLRIVFFERMRISASDPTLIKLLGHIIIQLHLIRRKLDLIMNKGPRPIINYSTSKVIKLFQLLKNFKKDNLALVFVERKTTAKVMFYILEDLAAFIEEYKYIKPDFIVGVNSNPYHITRECILERKKNHKILKKFNMGETNILVASDVIEEGIDVKNCNFVIKFDHPKTTRSYIQSKGRARHKDSKYIVFAPNENSASFQKNYSIFKLAEETLKQELCYGRDRRRKGGTEAEAELSLYSKEVEPFYINGPAGPKVTVESAIPLLNRYCFTLPCDKFTRLTVFFWKEEIIENNETKVVCYLQLPVNCPLKGTIKGQPCENLVTAKGAVALNACKMLYEIGELNDHLLPIGNEVQNDEEKILFPLWENESSEENPLYKPGTKKYRRIYDKQFPQWICGGFPEAGQPIYIHVIRILPNYPEPDNDRLLAFYNLLQSNKNFAVLSSKKWPKLCDFPLFMNVGEVSINIQQNARKITLSQEQYEQIVAFHSLLFTEAWLLKKEFLVKAYEKKENSYYVVPMIVDDDHILIDWDTINNHKQIPPVKAVPLDSRGEIVVSKDKYLNKIVIPWYRPKGYMLKYVVTRVCEEQTPMSPFPAEQYRSYSDYFFNRYNQSICNKNQKLIEVRAISGKNNCLLPRGKYRFGKKRRRDEEDFEETLVPELCTLLEFPAVYMLKVTLLPSILHRIMMLLNAEELRQKIAYETGLGVVKLPKGVYWNPLEVDDTALTGEENSNARSTVEVSNMLADKMVELQPKDFAWEKEEEPIDIERNLRNLDLLSILHYERFAKIEISPEQINKSNGMLLGTGSSNRSNIIRPPKVKTPDIPILSNKSSPLGPELGSVLKALIASSANDVMNYERLETLGDSFLKFLVSLILFINFENKDEGKLSNIKGKIIGNRNLYYSGKHLNLGKILKVNDFIPDDWEVPGFTILESMKQLIKDAKIPPSVLYQINLTKKERDTAVLNEETLSTINELFCNSTPADDSTHSSLGVIGQQCVVDKVIADAIEALIGVYLEACGVEGAFKLCKWLKILPDNMSDIDKVLHEPAPSAQILDNGDVNDVLIMPEVLESILGYRFKDRSFLLQALTHCSYRQNFTDCYQRLEFLGDAILDFLITSYIFNRCKNISPGELTDLRSALVNNVTFACLSVRYGFHKFLLTKACKLTDIIKRFVEHQEKRNHKIGAEILFLVSENEVKAAEIVDVPKVLGDLFESLAAAVYLDSGKSLSTVWKIFYKLMHNEIEEFIGNIPKNSIRLLYEKFPHPAPCFDKPKFIYENKTVVMVHLSVTTKNERMSFVGVGENKHQAKLAAAKAALRHYYLEPM